MKKDVIYIDIEDDITSIIEKVKAAQAKIVALVPPKRIGALQSVVNLKLLQRAAQGVEKRVVLITNDLSLTSLAAGVSIPVAKNLQSKPEIAPISTLEIDDEDIINGEELSIGELASTMPLTTPVTDTKPLSPFSPTPVGPVAAQAAANAPKKGPKIPNFDKFRKKILIFGGLGLALVIFSIWAIFFAPRAVIAITAKTTAYDINKPLTLSATAKLDADAGSLKAIVKEVQKTNSVDFTATGKKDVGEKAIGTVTLTNNDTDPVVVPAGSAFTTASGRQFTSNSSVTIPAFRRILGVDYPGTASDAVTAVAIGEEYNVGAQSLVSNDVTISARFDQATSGGSKRQITVVSDADVEAAKAKLTAQDAEAVKKELKSQFTADTIVMNESFVAAAGAPTVSPAVGSEAQGAKLTAESKYSMIGTLRDDLKKVLEANINTQLKGLPNQKIYDSGINKVRFSNFETKEGGVYIATVGATGYVGPNIDSAKLAKELVGKRAGEVQSQVQSIDGVESVDVKLSPFWVTTTPSKDKITIKFLIKNEAN